MFLEKGVATDCPIVWHQLPTLRNLYKDIFNNILKLDRFAFEVDLCWILNKSIVIFSYLKITWLLKFVSHEVEIFLILLVTIKGHYVLYSSLMIFVLFSIRHITLSGIFLFPLALSFEMSVFPYFYAHEFI